MPKNRFLAVFFSPVHSIGLLGQPKTGCGCRSVQKRQKKPDRTGPLNTIQSCWFLSYLTTELSSSPPLSNFHALSKLETVLSMSNGHFCLTTEQNFCFLSKFLTVWGQTGEGRMLLIKWVAWVALSSFPVVIWQIIDCVSQEESLKRTTTFAIFLVQICFFLNPTNSRPSQTSLGFNLTKRISLFEKRNDCRALGSRCGLHVVVVRRKSNWSWFQHWKQRQTTSHDLV